MPEGAFSVADHFNLPVHNETRDVILFVVGQVKGETTSGQREKRGLILQLGTLSTRGLNMLT